MRYEQHILNEILKLLKFKNRNLINFIKKFTISDKSNDFEVHYDLTVGYANKVELSYIIGVERKKDDNEIINELYNTIVQLFKIIERIANK